MLGIVLPNNTIAYADQRYKLDASQAEEMQHNAISPEKRFRFSSGYGQNLSFWPCLLGRRGRKADLRCSFRRGTMA